MEITLRLEEAQDLFLADLTELMDTDEDGMAFIEQNHFGDLLIEEVADEKECYRLWRNLDCNDGGIEVEYCGAANKYTWQTVYNSNHEIE